MSDLLGSGNYKGEHNRPSFCQCEASSLVLIKHKRLKSQGVVVWNLDKFSVTLPLPHLTLLVLEISGSGLEVETAAESRVV